MVPAPPAPYDVFHHGPRVIASNGAVLAINSLLKGVFGMNEGRCQK